MNNCIEGGRIIKPNIMCANITAAADDILIFFCFLFFCFFLGGGGGGWGGEGCGGVQGK